VLFSPVFAKFQQRLDHQPALPRSDVLSVRLLQAISFQAITHSFARRPAAIPFSINHFRTLFVLTEGVPSLPSYFGQLWCNLSPFRINTYGPLVCVANKGLTARVNPLDATLTKNRGMPVRYSPLSLESQPCLRRSPTDHGTRFNGSRNASPNLLFPHTRPTMNLQLSPHLSGLGRDG